MERSKALMTPMTSVSFESSGFGVTVTSDPNPGISSSIITGITVTATSREKHLMKSSDKSSLNRPYCLPGLNYPKSLISRMEISPLFDSFEVTESWMSSESILKSQGISFTPTFGPELSLPCITSRFTLERNWFFAYLTSCLPCWSLNLNLGYRCVGTS
jgi:hypothetical protein